MLIRILPILLSCILLQIGSGAAALASATDALVQKAVQKLDESTQKQIDEKSIVGAAVGVVYKDKLIFAKGYGLREVGKSETINPDTVFQLASVSKPISATVVAALIGDGRISWDSKISDLDPEFQLFDAYVTRELTIRDLYAHRSGLAAHAGDLLEDMGYNRQQVLQRLRFQKPASSFRSHYAYTNFGLTEGAVAAAKAYGLSFEEAAELKLFKALAMNSTSARFADYNNRSNKASAHVRISGSWQHKYTRQPDAQSPAGGISSSVNDMSKWLRLRLANGKFEGKQIVDENALAQTNHPQILTGFSPLNQLPGFYGLGMNVSYDKQGKLHLSHSGAFALGIASSIVLIPDEQLAVVVLTNTYPVGVAEGLTATFIDEALSGKQSQDWLALYKKLFADPATLGLGKNYDYSKEPETVSAALKKEAYLGTYTNDFFGDISIVEKDGQLSIIEGPQNMTFPLKHFDRDTFTYLPPGENSPGLSAVTFTINAKGVADQVLIENLNQDGQGSFLRKPSS